jgi:hypothetical protein
MTKKVISGIVLTSFILFIQSTVLGQAEKVGKTYDIIDKKIDWESFDTTSSKAKQNIDLSDLQGMWKAYKGVYKFDKYINGMNLTSPAIIEIKNSGLRRNETDEFESYQIQNNFLIIRKKNAETGIINKITSHELTITWKDGQNYTRYYYTK